MVDFEKETRSFWMSYNDSNCDKGASTLKASTSENRMENQGNEVKSERFSALIWVKEARWIGQRQQKHDKGNTRSDKWSARERDGGRFWLTLEQSVKMLNAVYT